MRAALRGWIKSQDADRALRQAEALFPVWYYRGSLSEGQAWVEEIMALPTIQDAADLQVRALSMLAYLARRHGEYTLALDSFNALLTAQKETGDKAELVETLAQMANLHNQLADFDAAWACLEASQAEAVDRADPIYVQNWRYYGGQIAMHEGRYELARSQLQEAVELTTRLRGRCLRIGYLFMNLGTVASEQGQRSEARTLLEQGLQIAAEYGDRTLEANYLDAFSGLASALEQHERALCLGGAAAALRDAIGAPNGPAWRRIVDRWLTVSRAGLSDEAAEAAWLAGQEMSLERAVQFAQAPSAPTAARAGASDRLGSAPVAGSLTRREREVAALIAEGFSNRQIAERLVITERTVGAHIEHILDKLAFTSRTQIGVWAAKLDPIGSKSA